MLALLILAVWSEPATIRTKGMTRPSERRDDNHRGA